MREKIVVYACGHHSTRGNLEADLIDWGLDADGIKYANGVYGDPCLNNREGTGRKFYDEIKPFLPDDYEKTIVGPYGIPGGFYAMDVPLERFKDPNKVLDILRKYFPKTFQEELP